MPLALNAAASASGNSVTLTTTSAPCVIYVVAFDSDGNAPVDITGVSDTAGLVWTERVGFGNLISFSAVANAVLSSDVITLTAGVGGANLISAFAVSGAAGFDVHSGIPDAGNSGGSAVTISTSGSPDFLIGSYGACDGAGSGWTQISLQDAGVQSFLVEYQIVGSPQSGTVVDAVNIRGSSNYLIDALSAPPPPPPVTGFGGRGGRFRRGGTLYKIIN